MTVTVRFKMASIEFATLNEIYFILIYLLVIS